MTYSRRKVSDLLQELAMLGIRPDRKREFDNGDVSVYFIRGRRHVCASSSEDGAVVIFFRATDFSGVDEIAPGTASRIARFLDQDTADSVVAEFSARVDLAGDRVAF